VGELFFLLWPKFAAGKIQQWNFNELSEVTSALFRLPTLEPSSVSVSFCYAQVAQRQTSADRFEYEYE